MPLHLGSQCLLSKMPHKCLRASARVDMEGDATFSKSAQKECREFEPLCQLAG
jgi:hypothetical protein